MFLKRFYDNGLAQASYLVGCAATGEALVVDANRDVEQYVRAAADEGLRITHVTETHIHADFVSGSRELAHRTGATLYLSDEGDAAWKYQFPTAEEREQGVKAVLVRDGDSFMVGNVRIDVVATPGHTPEHLTFVVTDTAGADRPMGAFTGDFVFVGDVGRPDLLERAAGFADTMEESARTLFRSLKRFREYPDWLQIWPGHGAGSACGKSLGAVPQSTLGYEKLFNWGLATTDEEEFVRAVLAGQPEPPAYFAQMKRINKEGPRLLGGFRTPEHVNGTRLPELLESGAIVVDVRPAADYAVRHVPGTINIPLNKSFSTWAGWLVSYDADFYLLAPEAAAVDAAVYELAMIGLDRVRGYFSADALSSWVASGRELGAVPQMTPAEVAARVAAGAVERGELAIVDVRGASEWDAGHLPDVPNIPVGHLTGRLDELPKDRPLVLHCQGGGRSSIAASVLRARGYDNVVNMPGGFGTWRGEGHPVVREGADGKAPASAS
ncbi:MAG TPA: rhodanese-like domain-containing protein [Gemmatimonadales bacterium]